MARRYRLGLLRRLGNLFMTAGVLLRLPRRTVLLETVGARSGMVRRTPVNVLEFEGRRWIVAPYGEVGWVHNIRASPLATLRRGLRGEPVLFVPAEDEVAAPVLKAYVSVFAVTRPFFDAAPDAAPAAFAAEAVRHPTFHVVPADRDAKRAI